MNEWMDQMQIQALGLVRVTKSWIQIHEVQLLSP